MQPPRMHVGLHQATIPPPMSPTLDQPTSNPEVAKTHVS